MYKKVLTEWQTRSSLKIVCYTPTLYILVGQVGRLEKYPLSQLDHEQIMIFDANEGKVTFSRSAVLGIVVISG